MKFIIKRLLFIAYMVDIFLLIPAFFMASSSSTITEAVFIYTVLVIAMLPLILLTISWVLTGGVAYDIGSFYEKK